MNSFCSYDNILLEILKIKDEKIILDYREVLTDINENYSIANTINSHLKNGHRKGMLSTSILTNDVLGETGHVIIRLKFFKYITQGDYSKTQREVDIIRSFTFVDIEGFNKETFVESNGSDTYKIKNFSLLRFKKYIDNLTNNNNVNYNEISSILNDILSEILSLKNLTIFFFGFISESEVDIVQSKFLLDLFSKCKLINNIVFMQYLKNISMSSSQICNNTMRNEIHLLNYIFSELYNYIKKNLKIEISENEVVSMEHEEKFKYLKNKLTQNNFSFQTNKTIDLIFEYVFNYFKSKARWKCLIKAREAVSKLTQKYFRVINIEDIDDFSMNIANALNKQEEKMNNYDEFFNSFNYNRIMNNLKEKEKVEKKSSNNFSSSSVLPEASIYFRNYESNRGYYEQDISLEKNTLEKNNSKEAKTHKKKSIESSLSQYIFKDLNKNLSSMFTGIFTRFTEEKRCMVCQSVKKINNRQLPKICYEKLVTEFKAMKDLQTKINDDNISSINND